MVSQMLEGCEEGEHVASDVFQLHWVQVGEEGRAFLVFKYEGNLAFVAVNIHQICHVAFTAKMVIDIYYLSILMICISIKIKPALMVGKILFTA